MSEDRTKGAPEGAPTDVFTTDIFDTTADITLHKADTGLYTVDGTSIRRVSERTLKKRLARLASSRLVFVLALLLSLSAALTAFRGYLLPVTLFLTAERAAIAVGLWVLYFTAGKKGGSFLAGVSLYFPIAAVAGLLFAAVFIICALFGKLLLFQTASAVSLVRSIYKAGLWAVIPILLCFMAAYCVYLFKRCQRQLLCNVRDGLRYGFAFENGSKAFSRNCILVAVLMIAIQIARAFIKSFSQFGFVPEHTVPMFDRMFLSQINYIVSLIGVAVHAAVLFAAAALARRYYEVVKRYKEQKKAGDSARQSAIQGASEVVAMEKEKAAERDEKQRETAENSAEAQKQQK